MDANDDSPWSIERRLLLARYPRSSWRARGAEACGFWLDIHDRLRSDAAALDALVGDYVAGRQPPTQLAIRATPRVETWLSDIHGHHLIEDFHYFPAFRRLNPRLAAGFDRLEAEHRVLTSRVSTLRLALGELNAAVRDATTPADARFAGREFVTALGLLIESLGRHLEDEEDLVVPLILEEAASDPSFSRSP